MNKVFCEKEQQTSAAVRSRTIDRDTSLHAQTCQVCSDILLVGKFLNDDCPLADHERTAVPDPTFIWRKAQLRANKEALRIALRPIRYMKVLACIAFACSPWLRLLLPIGRELTVSWSQTLDLNLAYASKLWPVIANESTVLLGAVGTIILLALSSWYMLRQE